MNMIPRRLAVVTGASSGIGFHLAELCSRNGFDLIIAADEKLDEAVATLSATGAQVHAVEADLSTQAGVEALISAVGGRHVDALLANAGHGLGRAFLDQSFEQIRGVIDTNVTGTLYLIHRLGTAMRDAGRGRILITGSIAGLMPGTFQAVYNGTKAFIDSFSWALRNELKDTGVTVTCLMPGATDTNFFARAGMLDTKVGTEEKADPADVAKVGFEAMMAGEGDVVAGWKNKLQATAAAVTPSSVLAEQHRKMAAPGTAEKAPAPTRDERERALASNRRPHTDGKPQ
jgi:short-subunit dehydrogenase